MGHHDLKDTQTSRKPRRLLSRLRSDNRGAVLMEFGIIVLPFIALLVASLQTSLVFFAQQNLDSAVEKSARTILTGETQNAATTKAAFTTQACANLPDFMTCANLFVSVQSAKTYSAANLAPPVITYTAGVPSVPTPYDTGDPGDIVVVRLFYPWTVQNGPLGFTLATLNNGKKMLTSTAVIKAEQY